MPKTIHLSLTVPDELDPEDIVETMAADFFDMNRDFMAEQFPHIPDIMSNIELRIINSGIYKVVEL